MGPGEHCPDDSSSSKAGILDETANCAAALSFAPAARDIQSPLAAPSVQPGVPTRAFPSSATKAFSLNMVQSDTPPLPSMSFFEASGLRSARAAAEHRFPP
ncbi:unnamed protein product [Symbiodinium natans]|uniref:Uncharacterized protein n=1 Tax=Symbiodinium natans TaxID=878477 RepID=A0A812RPX4_9DINO|nr:unnamed protein product [Symbiodinium natans]